MNDYLPHHQFRIRTPRFLEEFPALSFSSLVTLSIALLIVWPTPSHADIRIVKASGEHRMTDRETKVDAIRIAGEQAKREALDQVASYLESVTVVRDFAVTRDELRSYTAGMVLVLDQQIGTRLDGDVVVIRVDLKTQVDTDEVAQALAALKQQDTVREELLALKTDVDHLQQELHDANRALAQARSPEQTRQLNQQRITLLDQAESNAMVAQAWTDWLAIASLAQPSQAAGLAHVQALLGMAGRLNPGNPHLTVAQQTVAAHPAPVPPQPKRPPVPHTVPFLPGYSVAPQQPTQPGNSTTSVQTHPQPGETSPPSGRGTMPTYRQVPAPNGQSSPPTLHTYRAGGVSTASGDSPRSSNQGAH
ncbi:MAG: hypothetical protein JSR62_18770 [Nitrospira sp.]|nr:hypothetical protein [Nitrospira sp.]